MTRPLVSTSDGQLEPATADGAQVSMDVTKCEPFCSMTREDLEGNVGGAYTDPIF